MNTSRGTWSIVVIAVALLLLQKGGGADVPTPESGKRLVAIIHETTQDTPQFKGELIKLRKSGWFAAQGHSLMILDDDLDSAVIRKYQESITGLPCLLIADKQSGKLLNAQQLKPDVTADNITEQVRFYGG